MKSQTPALRSAMHSAIMILVVYILMQSVNYFRDNLIFGLNDFTQLVPTVWGFVGPTVIPPCLLFGGIIFLLALPLQKAQRKLDAGQTLTLEEAELTRKRLLAFSNYILALNLIGFAAGYILSLILQGRLSDMTRLEGIVIMTSNLSGGYVYAEAQSALNNMLFANLRDRLGIQAIGDRKREMRRSLKQAVLSVALIYYVISFMQYQAHDLALAKTIESDVLAELARGELQPEDTTGRYRELLAQRHFRFSTRKGLDVNLVMPPWERPGSFSGLQESVFLLLFSFIFLISIGIHAASSFELRDQIQALIRRVRDVVAGGGDLRQRINLRNTDDIGELTEAINGLLEQFQSVVDRIGSSAGETRQSAGTIAEVIASSREISRRTAEAVQGLRLDLEAQATQSRSLLAELDTFRQGIKETGTAAEVQERFVDETSAAMEEMRSNIESVEAIAANSRKLSESLAARGEDGGRSAMETAAAIKEIETASKQVLDVLGSLNKIAASINLLAMNAAIEAAHAGSSGLGFAVVADEVRKLAGTASEQTKNIKGLIDAMTDRVRVGVQRSSQTREALGGLVQGLGEAADLSVQVAEAMKEQGIGTRLVADSIVKVVDTAKTLRARMEEQGSHTESMTRALNDAFSRLDALAKSSVAQTENVHALEASFGAVNDVVKGNLESIERLTTEIDRYKA